MAITNIDIDMMGGHLTSLQGWETGPRVPGTAEEWSILVDRGEREGDREGGREGRTDGRTKGGRVAERRKEGGGEGG